MTITRKEMLDRLRSGKVGLVLCGGGFKGVYQIGVWKALKELGVERFACIAGTSAGALNAILIAKGDVEAAEKLWRNFPGLGLSPRWAWAYQGGYVLTFGPFILAIGALAFGVASAFLGCSPDFWLAAFGVGSISGLLAFGALSVASCATILRRVFFTASGYESVFLYAMFSFLLFLSPMWLVPALGHVGAAGASGAFPASSDESGWSGLIFFGSFFFGLACGVAGVRLLWFAQENAQLYSNDKLLAELRKQVDMPGIQANVRSVYITTARSKTFLNPFTYNVQIDRQAMERGSKPIAYTVVDSPGLEAGWAADYHDICLLQGKEEVIELLRLTAAIPIAFASGSSTTGDLIVDGGVVDNMPVLPLVMNQTHTVLVLCLDPQPVKRFSRWDYAAQYINESFRRYCLLRLTGEEADRVYRTYGRDGYERWCPGLPEVARLCLCLIGPRRPLPLINIPILDFLTGTLNQSQGSREKWLKLGYEETIHAFRDDGAPSCSISIVNGPDAFPD